MALSLVVAHPLARYLEAEKLTQDELARRAKVERSTITKVLNGQRKRFSPEAANRISKATNGKVTLEEALGLHNGAR